MATKTKRIELRTDQEFLDIVDDWRRTQPSLSNRSEAIRKLSMRGAMMDHVLPIILKESTRALINGGVLSPEMDPEICKRWSAVLVQCLDQVARDETVIQDFEEALREALPEMPEVREMPFPYKRVPTQR